MPLLALLACDGGEGPAGSASEWVAPENSWPQSTPPAELEASGYDEGDVPPDVRLPDQFADEVALWQFHGKLVVIDISPMWCAPCQELAVQIDDMMAGFEGEPLAYLNLLGENLDGDTPSEEDAAEWASTFSVDSVPVLADTMGFYANFPSNGQYPVIVGIDDGMVIFEAGFNPTGEPEIVEFIENNL